MATISHPTYGILGGAGPLVTAHLGLNLLVEHQRRTKAWQDTDFPATVCVNRALAGVGASGVEDPNLVMRSARQAVASLKAAGANRLLVACASLTPYLPADLGGLRLLDWLDWSAQYLKRQGIETVGVVGSSSARRDGLFHQALAAHGLHAVGLDNTHQAMADALIAQGMMGRFESEHRDLVSILSQTLSHAGAQAVWWGCTELSLLPADWLGPADLQSMTSMVGVCLDDFGVTVAPSITKNLSAHAIHAKKISHARAGEAH